MELLVTLKKRILLQEKRRQYKNAEIVDLRHSCLKLDGGRSLTGKIFSVVGKFTKQYGIKKLTKQKKSDLC